MKIKKIIKKNLKKKITILRLKEKRLINWKLPLIIYKINYLNWIIIIWNFQEILQKLKIKISKKKNKQK